MLSLILKDEELKKVKKTHSELDFPLRNKHKICRQNYIRGNIVCLNEV